MKKVLFALCTVFALSGCEQLRVESIPAGDVVACDQAFVGWWQVASQDEDKGADTLHLKVSGDCAHWFTVETSAEGQRKMEDLAVKMRFDQRRVDGSSYLAISDRPNAADHSREVGEGYVLLRYVVRAQGIDLFEGDPRREAHRIAEGLVRGKVDSNSPAQCGERGNCNVNTQISGDGAAIAEWLKRFDPLDHAFLNLQRIDEASAREFDLYLRTSDHSGKPRPHE